MKDVLLEFLEKNVYNIAYSPGSSFKNITFDIVYVKIYPHPYFYYD
jgi:hypothetical protein